MPAQFAKDLARFRPSGKPNTSDAGDAASVKLGHAYFDALGVSEHSVGDEPTGSALSHSVEVDISPRLADSRGLQFRSEGVIKDFAQYRHVGALKDLEPGPSKLFTAAWRRLIREARRSATAAGRLDQAERLIADVEAAVSDDTLSRQRAMDAVGAESLLKLDGVVFRQHPHSYPELEVGLSLKWTLRTDRAQDCRSQGAKLSSLRRGHMPHFAAVTMEPRPYMLNLLGGGSGDVDCVYHLHLPALTEAVETVYAHRTDKNSQRTLGTFRRLVDQRRLRDYDELTEFLARL